MKSIAALSFVLVFVLLASGWAGDPVLVGTLPTPGYTSRLTGLENLDGYLTAVSDLPGNYSCCHMINRWTGDLMGDSCFTHGIGACGLEDSLNFKSCGYIPSECIGCGDYVVGDECGAIIRYHYHEDFSPDTVQTFIPTSLETYASGMVVQSGYYYIVDPDLDEIHAINQYTLQTDSIIPLPPGIEDPSGLTMRGESFLVVEASWDNLYEVDMDGVLVATYHLEDMGQLYPTGITLIGDSLYVCSPDTVIKIYVFTESYTAPVPEGEDVEVVVIPDEVAITFDTVTDSGSVDAEVVPSQPCPPPGGVQFFSDYYDLSTDATFEYIAAVELMTETDLPAGIRAKDVRVFKRPSGEPCQPWRDITVAPLEFLEEPQRNATLRALTRTQSEDDEFSMFVLGEDRRNPRNVINLKFSYLDSAVILNQDSIPNDAYNQMMARIGAAKEAFNSLKIGRAARLVDGVAYVARTTPEIPHTYKPDGPQRNIAGQIISRAHTLSFSLRLLVTADQLGPSPFEGKNDPEKPAEEFAPRLGLVPNPAVSECTIVLSGQGEYPVNLSVYSVKGELIKTLLDGKMVTGHYSVTWNGRNSAGEAVAAGTYFVVLRHGDQSVTRRVILQR